MRLLTRDEEQKIAMSLENANSTGQEFPIGRGSGLFQTQVRGLTTGVKIRRKILGILNLGEGPLRAHWMEGVYKVGGLDTEAVLQKSLGSLSSASGLIVFEGASPFAILEKAKERSDLEAVIRQLVTAPYGGHESGKISPEVAIAAHQFLALVPEETPLPRVGPDHEGGLLMAWENTSPELIVTLEAHKFHFVVNPGTADAQYFDNIMFTGDRLPEDLLSRLPKTRT